ncbi:S8 family serine peptidase [candidate division WOR-3 bacterium]|nr:S8 family serine peptidase [candidate division WOR-3 bacterium]
MIYLIVFLGMTFQPPTITYPAERDRDQSKIVDYLEEKILKQKEGMIDIIVILWSPLTEREVQIFESLGGRLIYRYDYVTYGFSGSIPVPNVKKLSQKLGDKLNFIDGVGRGRPDIDTAGMIIRTNPVVNNTYKYKGDENSSIANLDTGTKTSHNDLGDPDNDNQSPDPDDWQDAAGGWPANEEYKLIGWKDISTDSLSNSDPVDFSSHGHGTHISGIIAGSGEIDSTYRGIAYKGRLTVVKFVTNGGTYWSSALIRALDWIVANKNTYRIKAANISASWDDNYGNMTDVANNVVANGIVLTCSAGNGYNDGPSDPYFYVMYPARAEKVLTVGATNDFDQVTGYSSNGTSGTNKPDVVAPGGGWENGVYANGSIKSTDNNPVDWYSGSTMGSSGGGEGTGTSFSSPIVAAVAGLLIQAQEVAGDTWDYTQDEALRIKSLILMTANETNHIGEDPNASMPPNTPPLNRGTRDSVEGYGRLCADAAIEAMLMWYPIGIQISCELDSIPFGKKVWARKVFLKGGENYTFSLTNPITGDFDLYLYEDSITSNGEPQIASTSTDTGLGVDEQINFSPANNDTFYLLVKWVNGEGTFLFDSETSDGGFDEKPQVTNNPGSSRKPSITAIGDTIYLVYCDYTPGNFDIFFKMSTDDGQSWQKYANLSNTSGQSYWPDICASDSEIHVVWQDNTSGNYQIYYTRSQDGGDTWDDSVRLSKHAGAWCPKIAQVGDSLHIVWYEGDKIYYRRSTNSGTSWEDTVCIVNSPGSWAIHPVVAASDTFVHVAFEDDRDGPRKIFYIRSSDGGATWGQPEWSISGEDSYMGDLVCRRNTLYFAYESSRWGGREICFRWGAVGGFWPTEKRLTYDKQSMSRNCVIGLTDSALYVFWDDNRYGFWGIFNPTLDKDIFYKYSTDYGTSWMGDFEVTFTDSCSESPTVAGNGKELYLSWADCTNGNFDIYFATYQETTGTSEISEEIKPFPDGYILVSPNPCIKELNVYSRLPFGSGKVEICLYDLCGRVVFENQKTVVNGLIQEKIPMLSLPSGIYFLGVYLKSKDTVFKEHRKIIHLK